MSENNRIDFVAEAQEMTEAAVAEPDVQDALVLAQIAVAEATLALVEQQRIANLIALGQAKSADGSFICAGVISHPADEWSVAVNDDIREGLGL